jgi:hypothetical protein
LKLVSQTERVCVPEQDVEENIRTSVGGDNRSLEKICIIRSFMICICILIKKLSDQTKDDELSEASGTHCTNEKRIWFCWENMTERDHLEDPDIEGRIILKLMFKK